MAHVITVANSKGGVAKTTTVLNLAAAFSKMGRKPVVLEMDPQMSVPYQLGLRPGKIQFQLSMCDVLRTEDRAALEDAVYKVERGGVEFHFVPAKLGLTNLEKTLPAGIGGTFLAQQLRKATWDYDLVLIDCPPTLGLLMQMSVVAADLILVPVQAELTALGSLVNFGLMLKELQAWDESLSLDVRYLPTLFDKRTRHCHEAVAVLRRDFGDAVLESVIPDTVKFPDSTTPGVPLVVWSPKERGAREYVKAAEEVASIMRAKDAAPTQEAVASAG
jgi:chromosome partitioning protein